MVAGSAMKAGIRKSMVDGPWSIAWSAVAGSAIKIWYAEVHGRWSNARNVGAVSVIKSGNPAGVQML
jgi:hypothetical protein